MTRVTLRALPSTDAVASRRPLEHDKNLRLLVLGAIGVVYGDIGTSPLYALKETFAGHHPLPVTPANILGVLSLVFWAITLLVSVKYVGLMMRADNRGEGGSLALLALVIRATQGSKLTWIVSVLGIFAAALFYGDSMITPAISVLSAVEGLRVVAPAAGHFVVPITVGILVGLFAVQRRGTGAVGLWFGPIMCLWFLVLAVLGISHIVSNPGVIWAINPLYAWHFIALHPGAGFLALGSVVLAVTGGEALYTDMGHFGPAPIRVAWFSLVFPALLLNYWGQGAMLLADPTTAHNPFFLMAPDWAQAPLVLLATAATIIASQAVISGAFSVARQAVQLGYLPRMAVIHTSGRQEGQIYVPLTNWTLCAGVVALVVGFRSSSNLAAAYGIAVTATMMIDTILIALLMYYQWRWRLASVLVVAGTFFLFDGAFLAANILKIPQGGWFPLLVGLISFTVLTTWKRGRQLVSAAQAALSISLPDFLGLLDSDIHRVRGTAVFMTGNSEGVPSALLHNLKHNQVLHQRVFLLTVVTAETPLVEPSQRTEYTDLGNGFYRLIVRFGFMEHPDIPEALGTCASFGHAFEMMETTFFLSRDNIVPTLMPGMALWRERLFALLSRNATPAHEFFRIPTNRVVELGTLLEI